MARNVFIVNCSQVVTSQSHPEGMYSVLPDYPKRFDSRSYPGDTPNGDAEAALRAAKSEYYSRLSANYAGSANRVMATVTLETADGRTVLRESIGAFPDMTPEPEVSEE